MTSLSSEKLNLFSNMIKLITKSDLNLTEKILGFICVSLCVQIFFIGLFVVYIFLLDNENQITRQKIKRCENSLKNISDKTQNLEYFVYDSIPLDVDNLNNKFKKHRSNYFRNQRNPDEKFTRIVTQKVIENLRKIAKTENENFTQTDNTNDTNDTNDRND